MVNVKLWLIVGGGGAKMDFVAGWLGTLPDFVSSNWHIDPATGQSTGFMQQTKNLDNQVESIEQLLNDHYFTLDPSASFTYVGTCHGIKLNIFKEEIVQNQIGVCVIDDSSANDSEILWNFAVKTFMTKKTDGYNLSPGQSCWPIDRHLTLFNDQERVAAFEKILKSSKKGTQNISYDFPITKIDYTRLFCPGGSHYLCDTIGITAEQRYHQYWDHMLPLSDSPSELNVWGPSWCKSNYF